MQQPRLFPELPRHREAVLPRHIDVEHDDVRLEPPCQIERRKGIRPRLHEEIPGFVENRPQEVADCRFIIDA